MVGCSYINSRAPLPPPKAAFVITMSKPRSAAHITCAGISRPLNRAGGFFAFANDDGFGLFVTPELHGYALPFARRGIGLASSSVYTPDVNWSACAIVCPLERMSGRVDPLDPCIPFDSRQNVRGFASPAEAFRGNAPAIAFEDMAITVSTPMGWAGQPKTLLALFREYLAAIMACQPCNHRACHAPVSLYVRRRLPGSAMQAKR